MMAESFSPVSMAGWESTLLSMARVYAGGKKAISKQQSKDLHDAYLYAVKRGIPLPVFEGGRMTAGQYMLSDLAARTKYGSAVVFAWLRALYEATSSGKIPRSHYDPRGASEASEARKSFATERSGLESITAAAARGVGAIGGAFKGLLFLGALAGGGYLWWRFRERR